ncbi:DUF4982 domain-containing protein [Chitinophaga sp. Cy-1792]|uniref:DUF4982 domain-containing protein n=1 Tax=Chitinophaga sp. Cy-1792 TaxID=2608339 RepID=UPI001423D05F|nr:DUF4982 domain-containing protein [Chitinophaga sp. Cy-1792]NIG55402.1 glycoside hydrolase family 2 protein [Chitinophaga sp. Cy-1792]
MKRFSHTAKLMFLCLLAVNSLSAQERSVTELSDNWKFYKGKNDQAYQVSFNDAGWQTVSVPHDWAIYGPFDKEIDKQNVAIVQNNERTTSEKTGRTGALPYIGEGWYRRAFSLPQYKAGQQVLLLFEGAMSEPTVYVNGQVAGHWNYGYNYFYFDITSLLQQGGSNQLAVHLQNEAESSRWYPGAGLYRKVSVIVKNKESIDQWGTYITTPIITKDFAKVNIKTKTSGKGLRLETVILDAAGNTVVSNSTTEAFGGEFDQNLQVPAPLLWSPETPVLYKAVSKLYAGDVLKDEVTTPFGIREIKYDPATGFSLNGKVRKFKGVCLHHDLGPLGAAINIAALRRQLQILKDLGCDAIRSSHNMPSLEQLQLADEMGFMFLAESFDEWAKPKVKNGYARFFEQDAEKDVVNLVHATRNHPCIVMWSAGNEVPDQWGAEGVKRAKWLQDIFHREDPTRPVTVGMDQVKATMQSGFGALLDIPGLNYRTHLYEEAYTAFPQGLLLGSETASTVSSRGVYKFPLVIAKDKQYDDHQSSSYDLEYCNWSNLPEEDFILQEDKPWVIGQFVWTGFDYLGEPTPYDDKWPSRSSYFGICDLAGIPKDRYYLYRSVWNQDKPTLHILPHWNFPGREGQVTPVFVYTSYDSAELFINGKSMGVQKKNNATHQSRYRLMWMDVKYEPGTVKVVAFGKDGKPAAEETIVTAGKPYKLLLEPDRNTLQADGRDISFVTVSVVDKDGNFCPTATAQLRFSVSGNGVFKAACNGDATSLEQFQLPTMKTFNGKLVVLVQSAEKAGSIQLNVTGEGLKAGKVDIVAK